MLDKFRRFGLTTPERANSTKKYRITEIPNSANTAERKTVFTAISLAVNTEIQLYFLTAVPRYRKA
jgi:hypothetical protein